MSVFIRILSRHKLETCLNPLSLRSCNGVSHGFKFASSTGVPSEESLEEEEFRVLELIPKKREDRTSRKEMRVKGAEPRSKQMAVDQDWANVWPGPRSYHPATVPLPLHQGYVQKGAPPGKFANAELMKIPNFLHLTPPAISKHCEALKKFCTKWPDELQTDEDIENNFPVQIITSDFCHSSPTIRDPEARIVSLKVKLNSLNLDEHARDKFLRLVGKRHDPKTDVVTITTDSCPIRKQNYDYCHYLLTAVYHESWITEDWEKLKSEADMEVYIWSNSQSKKNSEELFAYGNGTLEDTNNFEKSVENLFNDGENDYNLNKYKEASLGLLKLQKLES